MAQNLELKSEWVEPGMLKISWNEATLHEFSAARGTGFGLAAFGGFIFAMFVSLSSGQMWPFLLAIIWVVGCIVVFKMKIPNRNQVIITEDEFWCGDGGFHTDEITRVAVGTRQEFTGNRPYEKHMDPMEVRGWLNEQSSFVIASNTWSAEANGRIRDAIAKGLRKVRAEENEMRREQREGPTNQFGMPDY